MTLKELTENKELFVACAKEIEERARKGENPEAAKIAVFKAHGVEFNEDALNAKKVEKMPLSDEELSAVAGGESVKWCWGNYACFNVYRHDDEDVHGDACYWNYECFVIEACDIDGFSDYSGVCSKGLKA